jgi:hypothetical protein
MTILDIINKAGMENIKVQTMHGSLVKMHKKKHDTELTIATEHEKGGSVARESNGIEGDYLGLILWVPRKNLK